MVMGIRGIDILKGYTMENEGQNQETQSQEGESAAPPPEQAEPTPAQEPVEDDVAPDAAEPGDDVLPEELEQHVHEEEVPPDGVDQEG